MILDLIAFLSILYIMLAIAFYIGAVVMNFYILRIWSFKIKDGYLGVCKYPKWASFIFDAIALIFG